jgi:hypothetical protein
MWFENRFEIKRDSVVLVGIIITIFLEYVFTKRYVVDCFSSQYSMIGISLIFVIGVGLLFLIFYLFGQLGASSAYFVRDDMNVGRFPIGVSLYLLSFAIGLFVIFASILVSDDNSWDLPSLMGLALVIIFTVGLPVFGVFWTFYYELNWNDNEVINRSIFLRRSKPRHFDFKDIIDVAIEGTRSTLTFKDGSKLIINRSMAGERELLAAVEPFFRNL